MSKNKSIQISLKEAAELFTQLGFNAVNVSKWNAERFNDKLKKMAKIIDDKDEIDPSVITDKKVRKLFDSIADVLREGGAAEVVEVENADEDEKSAAKPEKKAPAALADEDDDKPSKSAAAAKPAKATKPAAKPKEAAATDAYGSREGSSGAKINAVLKVGPKNALTTDEIVKKSGVLKATVQEHLWKLRAVKKFADKNDAGWFLKK